MYPIVPRTALSFPINKSTAPFNPPEGIAMRDAGRESNYENI
jgi:hypothetical protein